MTTLQLQAYELISKLTDAQLHLIIDLMKDLTSTGESLNNLKNIRRKLGMFKGEKFLADNYHLDEDNKEIEKLFSADWLDFFRSRISLAIFNKAFV